MKSYFCGIFQWCNKWFFPRNLCTWRSRWSEKDVWNWGGLEANCFQGFHMYVFKPVAMQLCKYFVNLFSFWQIKQCKAKHWAGGRHARTNISSAQMYQTLPFKMNSPQDSEIKVLFAPLHFLNQPFPSPTPPKHPWLRNYSYHSHYIPKQVCLCFSLGVIRDHTPFSSPLLPHTMLQSINSQHHLNMHI